jgi:hypothetical protein
MQTDQFWLWRRPIDSRTPVRSPTARAGLTIYPTASQHVVLTRDLPDCSPVGLPVYVAAYQLAPFSARVGIETKTKSPLAFSQRALSSGDVLLSHGLSPYYHRGCSVSLPCSEWERVGPLRYCHQRSEPDWRFRRFAPTRISGDDVDLAIDD